MVAVVEAVAVEVAVGEVAAVVGGVEGLGVVLLVDDEDAM